MVFNFHSIKTRVTLAFSAVAMILILLCVLSIYEVIVLQHDYLEVVGERAPQMHSMSLLAGLISELDDRASILIYTADDETSESYKNKLSHLATAKAKAYEQIDVNIKIGEEFEETDEIIFLNTMRASLDRFILAIDVLIQETEKAKAHLDSLRNTSSEHLAAHAARRELLTLIDEAINDEFDELEEGEAKINEDIVHSIVMSVLAAIFSLVAAIFLGWIIARSINRPLMDFRDATGQFGVGNFATRVTPQALTEFDQLANAFNQMAEDLEATQAERDRIASELARSSRSAGMAEVATGILHNVGNVLNSVNVTSERIERRLKDACTEELVAVNRLIQDNREHLGAFLDEDERGKQVPDFLDEIAKHLSQTVIEVQSDSGDLRKKIDHIKKIVMLQQGFAKTRNTCEQVELDALFEDALRINGHGFESRDIRLVRQFTTQASVTTDQHKVLQIIVNLLSNAAHAMDSVTNREREIVCGITRGEGATWLLTVKDNGEGIDPANREKIFNHGFTTRKKGHGFGLHTASLMAKGLGGELSFESEGAGLGSTFCLRLPEQMTQSTVTEHEEMKEVAA